MNSFEAEGYFWWPDDPEEKDYPGKIIYNPINGGILRLNHGGGFSQDELIKFNANHEIILGIANNQDITLQHCTSYSASMVNGITEFSIKNLFPNKLYTTIDEIKYKEIYMNYSLLEFWDNMRIITGNGLRSYSKGENVEMSLAPKKSFYAKIENQFTLEYCISADMHLSMEEGKILKKPYFTIKYQNDKSLIEIEKDLYHLQNFLSLSTYKPIYISSIWSIGKDGYNEHEIFLKRKFPNKDLKKRPLNTIFDFRDIYEVGFEKAIHNWFSDYEQFKHIYDMFFLTHYTKNVLGFQFLSLVQALDSYTWIYIKNKDNYTKQMTKYLSPEEFKRRKNLILENIPDNEPEDFKEWVKDQLDNALGFKDRLLTLFDDCENIFNNIEDKEKFAKAIVETRNALSHGYSDAEYNRRKFCYRNEDLGILFYGAKMILTAVFLRKIGFSDDKNLECLNRFYRYSRILNGEYKFEEKGVEKIK